MTGTESVTTFSPVNLPIYKKMLAHTHYHTNTNTPHVTATFMIYCASATVLWWHFLGKCVQKCVFVVVCVLVSRQRSVGFSVRF